MQASLLVKRLGWGLVLLALLPFMIGVSMTPENTVVLSDSGSTGTFEITMSQADMSIIVFDVDGLYDCNEYEFFVFDENNQRIIFTKTGCDVRSDDTVYQYMSNPLEPGIYDFGASDEVEIVAVEGDLEAYVENYVLGEFLSSLGCGICCFGIVAVVGSRGLGMTSAAPAQNQVILMGQQQPSQGVPVVTEAVHSSMYQDIVEQAGTVVSIAEAAEDEAHPNGSFWGGISKD